MVISLCEATFIMSKTVLEKCYSVEICDVWSKICKSCFRKLEANDIHINFGGSFALAHVNRQAASAPEIFED